MFEQSCIEIAEYEFYENEEDEEDEEDEEEREYTHEGYTFTWVYETDELIDPVTGDMAVSYTHLTLPTKRRV